MTRDSQYSSCKPARLCHPAVCLPLGQVERDLYERCTALGMAIFSISHKLELKVSAYLYSPRYSEPAARRSPRRPALSKNNMVRARAHSNIIDIMSTVALLLELSR